MTAAPSLVFLHGFLGRPSSWDAVRDALRLEPSDIALSLPGHGPRPFTPHEDSFDSAVDALAAMIPSGAPRWLVGYSMGARLALRLLIRHAERFRGATLIGCHPGLLSESERAERVAADEEKARKLLGEGLDRFVCDWEQQPLFATRRALPAPVREAHRRRSLDHTAAGTSWAMRVLSLGRMPSSRESLAEIRVPLQLVAGSEDAKFRAIAEEIGSATPRASVHVVAGAGHDVPTEHPLAVAELLRAGLEQV
jgi:2-succinyl-6-hydroxy-2,4-cyclohexadiene-1-carboxylate synthase